jgi:hypothetical protein
MYWLNRFIKCADKVGASARFGAGCRSRVVQKKAAVTPSLNFARNPVFKNTRAIDAPLAPSCPSPRMFDRNKEKPPPDIADPRRGFRKLKAPSAADEPHGAVAGQRIIEVTPLATKQISARKQCV